MELKKERDYSSKVLMEIENETSKLREKYLTNLLNIEKEKIAIKNEIEKNVEEKVNVLRQKLLEKEELIAHLKKINARRERQQERTNVKEPNSKRKVENRKIKKR